MNAPGFGVDLFSCLRRRLNYSNVVILIVVYKCTPETRFSELLDGAELGGPRGTCAPPSFLDLCSKNFEISQDILFSFLRHFFVPPHKKIASAHPVLCTKKISEL